MSLRTEARKSQGAAPPPPPPPRAVVSLTPSGILEFRGARAWSACVLGSFRRPTQLSRCPLSLRPCSGEQVPPLTTQVARASNPGATTAIWVRDRPGGLWYDEDLADWYPRDGRPGLSPAQLATVCVLQFLLGLSDRQAAEAVRCRIDFKYAMARHEAPPFPGGGGRPPPLACRSRLVKLRAA
ncbi:transposase [Streptomyces sp. NPDC000983]|uniref:transposase n=1 Tax=Streptomyces sp. NPDC000983 TaxID=3154373 RepID=UPI0033229F2C